MAGQWRRGNCRSSCERGFCKRSEKAAVQLCASPSGSGLHFNQRALTLWEKDSFVGLKQMAPAPSASRSSGLPLLQESGHKGFPTVDGVDGAMIGARYPAPSHHTHYCAYLSEMHPGPPCLTGIPVETGPWYWYPSSQGTLNSVTSELCDMKENYHVLIICPDS
ncbi:hypothetical protein I79_007725 [Cricetulus griseus]|uniref:Uncharacterized protein n=1 Tax=Cricetulus griseus TaxID=10029 RepID=G3HBA0_CRIGR|nr:hypothetical protein I79_007725 [Cricetulus griseus]ERE68490.1 hypothetical protein H671_7g17867 [Cricetulus griseus]